jgi:transcriptional regulator of acetoin/glycerol metabolism
MESFLRYSWPGNLRQLNNVLKTAAVMAKDDHEITAVHLADDLIEELAALTPQALLAVDAAAFPNPTLAAARTAASAQTAAMDNLEQVEISTILRVLEACGGNVSMASKQLNISRNTLYRKLRKGG